MGHPKFDKLANEILHQICGYIDRTHKPSLKSLVLVNKHLHAITVPFLFHTLKLMLTHKAQLNDLSQKLPLKVLQNVRHLIIEGWLNDKEDAPIMEVWSRYLPKMPYQIQDSFYEAPMDSSSNWDGLQLAGVGVYHVATNDLDWQPLATLLSKMAVLSDLTYCCPYQLPRCVFNSVTSQHPNCRLHLKTFFLPSLRGWDQPGLDSYEQSLVTSPCLSSLAAEYSNYTQDIADYHYEAIQEIIAFMAPNLKNVSMSTAQSFGSLGPEKRRQPWEGLKLRGSDLMERQREGRSQGSLLQLSISDPPTDLETWSNSTDFSVLRVIKLGYYPNAKLFNFMTTKCDFLSLNTLDLDLNVRHFEFRFRERDYEQEAQERDNAISHFLLSLRSLSALKLNGDIGQATFDAMLVGHGETLRRLHFMPRQAHRQFSLGLKEFLEIKDCQQIEELTIKVRRSRGDGTEIASYKALGALPRLQNLWLVLDASNRSLGTDSPGEGYRSDDSRYEALVPNDSRFDEADKKMLSGIYLSNGIGIRRGFIRDTFINMAVDESLARSIFTTISIGKPSGAMALESMQVCVTGGFLFSNHTYQRLQGFEGLPEHMFQPLLVERNPRNDCRNELIVKNLKKEETYYTWNKPSRKAEECFKSIWPDDGNVSKVHGDWRDWASNWHSFPLDI